MLALRKRLRQWVSNVIIGWYSANLHITSIDDLSNEVKTSEYVFGSLMRSRLLSLRDGSIVVTIEIHWVRNARDNPKFSNELLDPNTSFAASDATIYSASVVESATVSCFELFQLTAPPFRQNKLPDCDLESSLSVWKLASV